MRMSPLLYLHVPPPPTPLNHLPMQYIPLALGIYIHPQLQAGVRTFFSTCERTKMRISSLCGQHGTTELRKFCTMPLVLQCQPLTHTHKTSEVQTAQVVLVNWFPSYVAILDFLKPFTTECLLTSFATWMFHPSQLQMPLPNMLGVSPERHLNLHPFPPQFSVCSPFQNATKEKLPARIIL